MRSVLIGLIFCISLSGCHRVIRVDGNVKNKFTNDPINEASIFLFDTNVAFTDSLGNFNYKLMTGYFESNEDPELLILKEGYKPVYLDIDKIQPGPGSNLNISLEPGQNVPFLSKNLVKVFYSVNLLLTIINLLTLIYITVTPVKNKWLWIAGVLCINIVAGFVYIDGSKSLDFFNGPFFIKHYSYYPLTIKLVIPIVTISFWARHIMTGSKIFQKDPFWV